MSKRKCGGARTRKWAVLFLACGMTWIPLGCGGQDGPVEMDLRIDNTPIERGGTSAVASYAEILGTVQPAVVSIYSERVLGESDLSDHPALRRFFGEDELPRERVQRGVGSGVIVSPQGYVLTNNHVIEDAEEILVKLADGEEVEAEIIGADAATDIAVLRINSEEDLPYAVLADSDRIEVGDVVFALGNALGIGHAVTSGIVSARSRTSVGILGDDGFENFIQTDAPMNIGNSGGPLVDSLGRVIGINTAIASPGNGNVGIGFAVPVNMAQVVMKSLVEFGEVRRGFLGITLQDLDGSLAKEFGVSEDAGVLVVDVMEESPALDAGLQQGDVVVALDGESVESSQDLRLKVAGKEPGEEVELGIVRDGDQMEFGASLGRREEVEKAEPEEAFEGVELLPGVMVVPLTPEVRERLGVSDEIAGLAVAEVTETSAYADVFPERAIILQINRETVEDIEEAREAINDGRNLFLLLYEGSFHYVVAET